MKIIATNKGLSVRLEAWEKVWALKNRIDVPVLAIERIEYTSEKPHIAGRFSYFRLPGTAIPGVFLAGTYVKRGGREFWYLTMRKPGVLTISIKKGELAYDELRLSVKADLAAKIVEWWGSR